REKLTSLILFLALYFVSLKFIKMNLFIGNLSYTVKAEDLQELFQSVGEVSSAKIITDKFTGRSRGFGFVEMPNDNEARTAIETLNGRSLRDREISVTEAEAKTEGGGNRGGGGFNRDRNSGGGGGGFRGGNDRGGFNKRY
ncbi:MAG TPA: hypothetical protein VGB95_02820, partial [Chitinophagales bacterium]